MKRDLNLVRRILLDIEAAPVGKFISDLKYDERANEEVMEHVGLLIEAGYLEGQTTNDSFGRAKGCIIKKLTWEGHEFLANARNDTVWKSVMTQIGNKVTNASMTVLNALLEKAVLELVR